MKRIITISLVSALVTACGGGSSGTTSEPALGAATTDPYDQSTLSFFEQQGTEQTGPSSQINSAPEFGFRTSSEVSVSLDFAEARGQRATVLMCTDYTPTGDAFTVDYDSCLVRAPLLDGYFEHDFNVMTRHQSIISVVWFAEPGQAPLYQEIVL